MTDAVQEVTTETLDAVKFFEMKNNWKAHVRQAYVNFRNSIGNIPTMQAAMIIAVQNLETGMLWMDRAIDLLPIDVMKPAQPSQPQTPATDSACEAPQDVTPTEDEAKTEADAA